MITKFIKIVKTFLRLLFFMLLKMIIGVMMGLASSFGQKPLKIKHNNEKTIGTNK